MVFVKEKFLPNPKSKDILLSFKLFAKCFEFFRKCTIENIIKILSF